MPGPARAFDENEVVDAALRAFWERGFDGTKLSTVLEEVGIGRQSLYNAFENKEALYVAALVRYRQERIGGLVLMLEGSGPPAERIRTVFEAIEADADGGVCWGCFVANAIAEFAKTNAAVLAEIEGSFADLTGAFTRTLEEARLAGEVPSAIVPEEVAQLCSALVEGVTLLNRVQSGPEFAASVRRGLESLLFS